MAALVPVVVIVEVVAAAAGRMWVRGSSGGCGGVGCGIGGGRSFYNCEGDTDQIHRHVQYHQDQQPNAIRASLPVPSISSSASSSSSRSFLCKNAWTMHGPETPDLRP